MNIKEITTRQELYCEFKKYGVGAEVGVCRGHNAMSLYQIAKPNKFYLCDIWIDGENVPRHLDPSIWRDNNQAIVERVFEDEISTGVVEIHKDYGESFLATLPDNSLDWVYLDANHNYQPVSVELKLAIQKVKAGGFIAGHDYCTQPVAWKTGVIRAVNEEIQHGNILMEALTTESYPSFLCRVIK
jgi:hypothetical protein